MARPCPRTLCLVLVVLACLAPASQATASPTSWRVVARSADAGGGIAVAAAVVRRAGPLAIRVRSSSGSKQVRVLTVVACSVGELIRSKTTTYVVRAPAMRMLRLPVRDADNCGVTAIGSATSPRSGGAVGGRVEIEILTRL